MPTTRYTSTDGLMTSSDPRLVALWEEIGYRKESPQDRWNTLLRGLGVKMVHVDNSVGDTVETDKSELIADPEPGDLIALGEPTEGYRIVAVTQVMDHQVRYADHGHRLPEPRQRPHSVGERVRHLLGA